jgi:hypothetical protein
VRGQGAYGLLSAVNELTGAWVEEELSRSARCAAVDRDSVQDVIARLGRVGDVGEPLGEVVG